MQIILQWLKLNIYYILCVNRYNFYAIPRNMTNLLYVSILSEIVIDLWYFVACQHIVFARIFSPCGHAHIIDHRSKYLIQNLLRFLQQIRHLLCYGNKLVLSMHTKKESTQNQRYIKKCIGVNEIFSHQRFNFLVVHYQTFCCTSVWLVSHNLTILHG